MFPRCSQTLGFKVIGTRKFQSLPGALGIIFLEQAFS